MKLFSYSSDKKTFNIGVRTTDGDYNLTEALDIYQNAKGAKKEISVHFLQMFVEMGYCSASIINNIFKEPWVQSKIQSLKIEDDFTFDVPIPRPSKIICLGRNYKAHAKELNHQIPDKPIIFCKASSSITPHDSDIIIPSWLDTRVDHEAELGLIIGKAGKNIKADNGYDHIAGYTIINDITARDMQKNDMKQKKPWFRSKSLDTFCPVGPFLVPADVVENPHDLDIILKINGKERQNSSTSRMIFKIPEIIAYISTFMTLLPGDLIATGTPEGVSAIKDGDRIEISISELGTLANNTVKE